MEKKTDPKKGAPGGDPNDLATQIKAAVAAAGSPLQQELVSLKTGEVGKTRLQALTEKFKDYKDDNFKARTLKNFGRMHFETDEDFNEYLTETETAVATANQNLSDSKLSGTGTPFIGGGAKTEQAVVDDIKEWSAANAPKSEK